MGQEKRKNIITQKYCDNDNSSDDDDGGGNEMGL